mgnify:CR=1 FL=1
MYSVDLNRVVSFRAFRWNESLSFLVAGWQPSWLSLLAQRLPPTYSSMDASGGGNLKRLTSGQGPDVSPTWNRKTGAQIAFVSGRTGLPQIYTMEADGTNVQRLTDQGYAVSPNWAPNGQFLDLFLDAQVWPRSAGLQRSLPDGHRQQAVGAADSRCRPQRFSVLVARMEGTSCSSRTEPAPIRFVPCWPMGPSVKQLTFSGQQLATQLELEVGTLERT